MPVVGDLCYQWQKALDAGYWERQNAPEEPELPALPPGQAPLPGGINTDKAPAFVRAFAQLSARGQPVTCECPGDAWCADGRWAAVLLDEPWGRVWVCAKGVCGFRVRADSVGDGG